MYLLLLLGGLIGAGIWLSEDPDSTGATVLAAAAFFGTPALGLLVMRFRKKAPSVPTSRPRRCRRASSASA